MGSGASTSIVSNSLRVIDDISFKLLSQSHPRRSTVDNDEEPNNMGNELVLSGRQSALQMSLLAALLPLFLENLDTLPIDNLSSHETENQINSTEPGESQTMAFYAAKSVDTAELPHILPNKNWFALLINTVEHLDICVSIATARADRPGFPLVYVNKAFERVTQYERKDIIGHNCRFLQGENTDPEHVAQIGTALRTGTATRVTLLNQRKDGTEFRNLLSMLPMFNNSGVYSYVLGIQLDISAPANCR